MFVVKDLRSSFARHLIKLRHVLGCPCIVSCLFDSVYGKFIIELVTTRNLRARHRLEKLVDTICLVSVMIHNAAIQETFHVIFVSQFILH